MQPPNKRVQPTRRNQGDSRNWIRAYGCTALDCSTVPPASGWRAGRWAAIAIHRRLFCHSLCITNHHHADWPRSRM